MSKKQVAVGLLANHASIDKRFVHTADRLPSMGMKLVALFAPQQGFHGQVQANMVEVASGFDAHYQVPLYSLYSEVRRPTAAMLQNLEHVVIDLQEVGTRGYTFIWTVLYMLEECDKFGIPVTILDRPNPIGGLAIEGHQLQRDYFSFVGLHDIPIRHGMTVAELAKLFCDECNMKVKLTIKKMRGWQRAQYFDELGLPWVMPSANVPTPTTTILYPGMELFEGTNISEGRGTTRPFEMFGAPFINADKIADQLHRLKLPGVFFRPTVFQPTFDKWKGQACQGAQIHITHAKKLRPVLTAVAILQTLLRHYPRDVRFNPPPYEYETKLMPFDILAGSSLLRELLMKDMALRQIEASWLDECHDFARRRRPFLIY